MDCYCLLFRRIRNNFENLKAAACCFLNKTPIRFCFGFFAMGFGRDDQLGLVWDFPSLVCLLNKWTFKCCWAVETEFSLWSTTLHQACSQPLFAVVVIGFRLRLQSSLLGKLLLHLSSPWITSFFTSDVSPLLCSIQSHGNTGL